MRSEKLPGIVKLARWHSASGDRVSRGQIICEIEVEEAFVDVPAWRSGILHHLADPGQQIRSVNALAKIIRESAEE